MTSECFKISNADLWQGRPTQCMRQRDVHVCTLDRLERPHMQVQALMRNIKLLAIEVNRLISIHAKLIDVLLWA